MKIVKDTVNYLGGIGSGKKFTEEEFNSTYSSMIPCVKAVCIGYVTKARLKSNACQKFDSRLRYFIKF